MAFEVFNFGKQLGIVGGGLEGPSKPPPILVGRIEREALPSTAGGTGYGPINGPVYGPSGGGSADEPAPYNPWVHKQILGLLEEIYGRGNPETHPGSGGGSGGSGGGGGTGWGGGEGNSLPAVDIDLINKALEEWRKRVDTIKNDLNFDYYCRPTAGTDSGDHDCCSLEERELMARTFEAMFDKIKQQYPDMAKCLREKIKGLKVSCPDESFFYTSDSIYEDPNYDSWFDSAVKNGSIEIPKGMIDLQDGAYLLSSIVELCNPDPDDFGLYMAAFALLGITPSCADIKSYVNAMLKRKRVTWKEFRRSFAGLFWGDNLHGYDPRTGNVYKFKDGKAVGVVAKWPRYENCLD